MSKTFVPLSLITDSPYQARLDVGDTEALAETILEHGLRQLPEARLLVGGEQPGSYSSHTEPQEFPAPVRSAYAVPERDKYEAQLASGHRRAHAVQLLNDDETVTDADLEEVGLPPGFIPVDLQRLSDTELLDLGTIENVQREGLSPIEEARGIRDHVEMGRSNDEIGDIFGGRSASWVSNRKRLLSLPTFVQEHVHQGDLSIRQAQAFVPAYRKAEEVGSNVTPDGLVEKAVEKGADSDWLRKQVGEFCERVYEEDEEDEAEDFPELPDGWRWAPDVNSDYDYRAVRRYDEWTANGAKIWLVATGDTAERAIDQAIHFDTYFVDHDPSEQLVEDGEVIMGLPYEWVWVACSAKVDGIPVYTPYHFVDGSVDDPGEVRKWAAGKGPFDKAKEAWKMHRRSHESTDQTDDDRAADEDAVPADSHSGSRQPEQSAATQRGPGDHSDDDAGDRPDRSVGVDEDNSDVSSSSGVSDKREQVASVDASTHDGSPMQMKDPSGDGAPAPSDDSEKDVPANWPTIRSTAISVLESELQSKPFAQEMAERLTDDYATSPRPIAVNFFDHVLTPEARASDQGRFDYVEDWFAQFEWAYLLPEPEYEESATEPDVGQVVPGQVDTLLSADGEEMWDEAASEMSTIASLLAAHRVASARREHWRTELITEEVRRRAGTVTEEDVPEAVMADVRAEVQKRTQAQTSEEPAAA